jgi:hypothetical protein
MADRRSAAGLERRHGPVAFLRAAGRNLILTVVTVAVIRLAIVAVVWIRDTSRSRSPT